MATWAKPPTVVSSQNGLNDWSFFLDLHCLIASVVSQSVGQMLSGQHLSEDDAFRDLEKRFGGVRLLQNGLDLTSAKAASLGIHQQIFYSLGFFFSHFQLFRICGRQHPPDRHL